MGHAGDGSMAPRSTTGVATRRRGVAAVHKASSFRAEAEEATGGGPDAGPEPSHKVNREEQPVTSDVRSKRVNVPMALAVFASASSVHGWPSGGVARPSRAGRADRDKAGANVGRNLERNSQTTTPAVFKAGVMDQAERGRFELPQPLLVDRFSKPAHSTTLPPLRVPGRQMYLVSSAGSNR